jgi:hypothetical protein
MAYEFEISYQPRTTWDNEILDYEFPEIYQTSLFGELILKSGKTPGFISIFANGKLVGNCLIEISNEKIATWSYGPLIKSEKANSQEEIIDRLQFFLKQSGIISIENVKTRKYFNRNTAFNERAGIYSRIGESPYIDIRPGMEELLHSFDRSVRKNVNKCERTGVEIVISENTDLLEPYMEMLSWFRSSRNFGMPSFFPHNDTIKMFNTSITSMGIALAKFEGHFLSGMGFVTIGNTMTELAMATSKEFETAKLPVNDYLKVKAIEFYKQKGITLYDLAGGEKNPTDPKKKSILVYKQKFATGSAPYGMIDRKILTAFWYPIAVRRKIKYLLSKLPRT